MNCLCKASSVAYDMACKGPDVDFTNNFVMVCGVVTADEEHLIIQCKGIIYPAPPREPRSSLSTFHLTTHICRVFKIVPSSGGGGSAEIILGDGGLTLEGVFEVS